MIVLNIHKNVKKVRYIYIHIHFIIVTIKSIYISISIFLYTLTVRLHLTFGWVFSLNISMFRKPGEYDAYTILATQYKTQCYREDEIKKWVEEYSNLK